MHLFYTPDIRGDLHELDEAESKHAFRVLRLREGEEVVLVDGKGGWYEARIQDAQAKCCSLLILNSHEQYQPLSYKLHIAMAPTKHMDRFEWFLEKATEIGISEITPLLCQRSERKQVKTERLERILVSAMKQSLKAYKPKLNDPIAFKDFIAADRGGAKAMAHCMPVDRITLNELGKEKSITVLVGPEGDFSEEEADLALQYAYRGLSLGPSRLRTETSGVHICSAISLLNS